MSDKKKYPRLVTPKGTFAFPKLRTPDTKFKKEGEYSVKLVLDKKSADELIKKIQPHFDAAVKAGQEEYDGLKKVVKDKNPFKTVDYFTPEYDDDDEPTGNIVFSFKMTASGEYKNGPKKGQKWTRKPALFDAKGKPLPTKVEPWGGTVGKVSFEVVPFFTVGVGAGVSLRLQAVQVIDLIQGGERGAKDYGFGEEDGYEADEEFEGETSDDEDDEAGCSEEGDDDDDF